MSLYRSAIAWYQHKEFLYSLHSGRSGYAFSHIQQFYKHCGDNCK